MQVGDLHMSCGLESPARFIIGSNRRCSSVIRVTIVEGPIISLGNVRILGRLG